MAAVTIDIADAVTAELAGGSFSQGFTPVRLFRPDFDVRDLSTLHVSVVPAGIEEQQESRSTSRQDVEIQIGVQQKVTDDNAAIDPLVLLVQEIGDFFRERRLVNFQAAMWRRTEIRPLYFPDELRERGIFVSIPTITFRVFR